MGNIIKKNKDILPLIMVFLVFVPLYSFGVEIPPPTDHETLADLINDIIAFIRTVALVIAPIIFIFAGLKYYFAGGSPEKAKEATNLIKWALIGLAIVLVADGIASVIADIMGVEGGD